MECEVKNCSRIVCGLMHKLCSTHYNRRLKYGDVYADVPVKKVGREMTLPKQRKILQAKTGKRYCVYCNKYKKIEEFDQSRKHMCKLCRRNIAIKNKYHVNSQDYDELLKKQKGKCALCKTRNTGNKNNFFDIDHNHRTNKIRGLLCNICNRFIIGNIEKRKISIVRLTKYLE